MSQADLRINMLLSAAQAGDVAASTELIQLLYVELKAVATALLRREGTGPHTLQPTALVNEAFIRLLPTDGPPNFADRAHFFRAAARAMRNILIDRARSARISRRTGSAVESIVLTTDTDELSSDEQFLALDGALKSLEARDHRQHDVVMLRFFAGLTIDQTADALGVSAATVKNEWTYARAWLLREMERSGQTSPGGLDPE